MLYRRGDKEKNYSETVLGPAANTDVLDGEKNRPKLLKKNNDNNERRSQHLGGNNNITVR